MQALQYTRALKRIVQDMKVVELLKLLDPLLGTANVAIAEGQKQLFAQLLFGSRAAYERLAEDPTAKKIMRSLDVGSVYDPTRLSNLMVSFKSTPNSATIWTSEFFRFHALLGSLRNLDKSCSELLEKEKLEPAKSPEDVLELQLIDYDGLGIEPIRLTRFVTNLIKLHANVARILGVTEDLRLIYFDSGSALLIGVLCAKTVMDAIKTLLDEWWDKIRFRQLDTFERKMEAVSKGLTVLETVKHSVESHVINADEGRILTTRVLREVDQLIGLGASLPVSDDVEKIDHVQLLLQKRDIKLLGSGPTNEETEPDS